MEKYSEHSAVGSGEYQEIVGTVSAEPRMPQHYAKATFIGHVEWPTALVDGKLQITEIPQEIQTDLAALHSVIQKQIASDLKFYGATLVHQSALVTVVEESPDAPIVTQGAYLQLEIHVQSE